MLRCHAMISVDVARERIVHFYLNSVFKSIENFKKSCENGRIELKAYEVREKKELVPCCPKQTRYRTEFLGVLAPPLLRLVLWDIYPH